MKIALRGSNGKYVCAENGGDDEGIVHVNRSNPGPWETFTVHLMDGLHVALESVNGRYLCAELGGGGEVHCNRLKIGPWETFAIIGDTLRTHDGHFLGVGADDTLVASFSDSSAPETHFIPEVIEGNGLQKLHVDGLDFKTEDGLRHVIKGSTELLLGWRYDQEGEAAIREVLQQRRDLGFNNLRVLWQKDIGNTGHSGWQMPFDKLVPFLYLAEEYAFYIQGTILADCQVINPDFTSQSTRVIDVRNRTIGVPNLIEQLGNEYDKNGHNPLLFAKPSDRLAANSSSTEGGKDAPYWDFFCFSGQRSPLNHAVREYGPLEFMYGDGNWGGVPAICDEGFKPGINSTNPRDYERAGAQARSGCGGRFHTTAGTSGSSSLFNSLEIECAKAFIQGIG